MVEPGRRSLSAVREVFGGVSCWLIGAHDGVCLLSGLVYRECCSEARNRVITKSGRVYNSGSSLGIITIGSKERRNYCIIHAFKWRRPMGYM